MLLESIGEPEQLGRMTAAADDEEEMDAVVESLVGNGRDTSALGRKMTPFDTDDLT